MGWLERNSLLGWGCWRRGCCDPSTEPERNRKGYERREWGLSYKEQQQQLLLLLLMSLQSCPTLRDPMDCSLPGSSVHGIIPGKSTGVGCHCLLRRTAAVRSKKQKARNWAVKPREEEDGSGVC